MLLMINWKSLFYSAFFYSDIRYYFSWNHGSVWGQSASVLLEMTSPCHVYLRSTVFGILYNVHLHNVFLCKRPSGGARVSLWRELSNLSYVNPQHCGHWLNPGKTTALHLPLHYNGRHMASKTTPPPPFLLSVTSWRFSLKAWVLGGEQQSSFTCDTEEDKSTVNHTQIRLETGFVICLWFSTFPGLLKFLLTNWILTFCCTSSINIYFRGTGGFVYQVSNQTQQIIVSV